MGGRRCGLRMSYKPKELRRVGKSFPSLPFNVVMYKINEDKTQETKTNQKDKKNRNLYNSFVPPPFLSTHKDSLFKI